MLTYVRVRSASRQGLFRALHRNIALSELAFERACLSAMALFRRRSNEQLERDVLRHDVILFGVEPLTNAHSFGASLSTMFLFRRRNNENSERDVLRHNAHSFGVEPLTKRSQGVSPLERRGDRVSAEGWTGVSSDALMPERRRCPLKPWGPFGGNGFWGNPQEGA